MNIGKKRLKRKKILQGRKEHELGLLNRDKKSAEERRLSSKRNKDKKNEARKKGK